MPANPDLNDLSEGEPEKVDNSNPDARRVLAELDETVVTDANILDAVTAIVAPDTPE